MVIVIKTGTPEAAIRQLLAQLAAQNVKGGCVAGPNGILLPLVGDTWRLDPNMLQGLPYVQEVRRLTPAYRLAGRAAHPANTVVAVGDAKIGEKFCMIAGPCAVESAPQMAAVAQSVKESGAQLLRGGAFKPRTSPYTFQGLEKAGLDLLVQAGRDAGLPVVTEITDISQLDLLADVDVLQVGARNMQNYTLLKALGQLRRPVLLKRGLSATVEEFLLAAEYLLSGGNEQVTQRCVRRPCRSGRVRHPRAEAGHPPAGAGRPQPRGGPHRIGAAAGAGRRSGRSRRPDGGGPRPPRLRPVRRRAVPDLPSVPGAVCRRHCPPPLRLAA